MCRVNGRVDSLLLKEVIVGGSTCGGMHSWTQDRRNEQAGSDRAVPKMLFLERGDPKLNLV